MSGPFNEICELLRRCKLDDSLLFLGHLRAVIRHEIRDPGLEQWINRLKTRPPEFVIHFVAKWLLLEANNFRSRVLDFNLYKRVQDLYFRLDDPIVHDPAWKDADPSGFFERLLSSQFPAQGHFQTLDIGLPLALFRDAGSPRNPGDYDLRGDLEAELGTSIEEFIAMGYLCMAARFAAGVRGTLTPMYFAEACRQGLTWCKPEAWGPFLRRVCCTRDGFRAFRNQPEYRVKDPLYLPFEFNPLHRFPLVDVGEQRFIGVDPDLVLTRTTWGLYFDLFERDRTRFSNRFGDVFDRLIGDLLHSVVPAESLWSDSGVRAVGGRLASKKGLKRGDWAYKGAERTVLFECKALRPSLDLLHYGGQEAIEKLRERIVSALEQVITQSRDMGNGIWADEGLSSSPTVCVLISYGRFYAVNLPFFRDRVRNALASKGYTVPPFVVLSLKEFDTAIRLAELGEPLDRVLLQAADGTGSAEVMRQFAPKLEGKIVASTFAHSRNQDFESKFLPSFPDDEMPDFTERMWAE